MSVLPLSDEWMTAAVVSETELVRLYDERDAYRRRLYRVAQVLDDFQQAAAELDRQCRQWELRGEHDRAERGHAQAEQMRSCCIRFAAVLRGPLPPPGAFPGGAQTPDPR